MATLKRRLEGEIEITAAGGDAFYDIFVYKPECLIKINPEFIQAVDLLEGSFGTPGSMIRFSYILDGKDIVVKKQIEVVEKKNKMIRYSIIEGTLLNDYKNFIVTQHVIPNNKKTSIVKWTLEYEKRYQGIPEPTTAMDALIGLTKDADYYYLRQNN